MDPSDQSFEKLDVWRRSHELSIEIYRQFADCRDWGFKDQITRSANSISDNIAEGSERTGRAEFKQFLSSHLTQELREISRMIHGLIKSLDR